jgi:hypothetical protein
MYLDPSLLDGRLDPLDVLDTLDAFGPTDGGFGRHDDLSWLLIIWV